MPENISHSHPTRTQLLELLARNPPAIEGADAWRIGRIDPEKARDAAVLILFGVLDDSPSESHCGAVGDDLDLLILVRSNRLRHHAGQPAFPGGRVDPEDYDEAARLGVPVAQVAALREAVEETGLDASGVEILGQLEPVALPVSNFMVTPVIAWWTLPTPVAAVDTDESTLVVRVPVADLLDPENRHTAAINSAYQVHKSPAFDVHGDHETFTIWGFTGFILSNIFKELGWELPWNPQKMRDIGA